VPVMIKCTVCERLVLAIVSKYRDELKPEHIGRAVHVFFDKHVRSSETRTVVRLGLLLAELVSADVVPFLGSLTEHVVNGFARHVASHGMEELGALLVAIGRCNDRFADMIVGAANTRYVKVWLPVLIELAHAPGAVPKLERILGEVDRKDMGLALEVLAPAVRAGDAVPRWLWAFVGRVLTAVPVANRAAEVAREALQEASAEMIDALETRLFSAIPRTGATCSAAAVALVAVCEARPERAADLAARLAEHNPAVARSAPVVGMFGAGA